MLWLLVRRLDWPATFAILARVDLRIALFASAFTVLLIAILAFRWTIFLRQQDLSLPFPTVLSLTWAGQFFNSVLPGSTGGDAVKILHLCRMMPDRKAAAAVSVVVDRLSALLALALLAGLAVLFGPTAASLRFIAETLSLRWHWIVAGAVLFAGVIALAWLLRSAAWRTRLRNFARTVMSRIRLNGQSALALLIALGIHLANFAIAFGFARAVGIEVTYAQMLLFMPVVLLLVMLPITINGHGLREVLLIFYFTQLGIGSAEAMLETVIGFSLLMVANDLLWATPGGLWYLFMSRVTPVESAPATG